MKSFAPKEGRSALFGGDTSENPLGFSAVARSQKSYRKKGYTKMAKDMNLQDVFLNQSRKERIPVTIYITNGFQFRGIVKGFDNYTVILDSDGRQNLIYKHAISTITPLKPISLLDAFEKDEKDD